MAAVARRTGGGGGGGVRERVRHCMRADASQSDGKGPSGRGIALLGEGRGIEFDFDEYGDEDE